MPTITSIMMYRVFTLLLVIITLGACADGSDRKLIEPSESAGVPGPFGVGHSTFTAIDELRENRSLNVDVWYPVDSEDWQPSPVTAYLLGGMFPLESAVAVEDLPVSKRADQTLLVFSHGYRGTNTQSVALMEALASHGFIVLSPEHTGNSQSDQSDSFDEAAANRVPDVSFLIDTMIERNQTRGDAFHNRLDEGRIGVLGHSFGGMTAIGAAAGWAGAGADPRVAAIVPISSVIDLTLQSDSRTGPNAGFTPDQLAAITVPVMLMGGTEDTNVLIENNAIAFVQLVNSPAVYRVDIIGATHTHFAYVCAIGDLLIGLGLTPDLWPGIGAEDLNEPYEVTCGEDALPIGEATRLQNLFIVSFFRRHLLGEIGYDYYLDTRYAQGEPHVDLKVRTGQ